MILKSFKYSEHEKDSREWILKEFSLKNINLIVGKNASGKSRTLNVINAFARVVSEQKIPFGNGSYYGVFDNQKGSEIIYEIKLKNGVITKENLKIGGIDHLIRGQHGSGKLRNAKVGDEMLEFKIPPNEAAVTRRDSIQYPYLDQLFEWGNNLRYFRFNTELGKGNLAVIDSKLKITDINLKLTDRVVEIYRRGESEYGSDFIDSVVNDLNYIGYEVDNLAIKEPESITVEASIPLQPLAIAAKERDLSCHTDQNSMSTGMFRALAVLVYFNYYQFAKIRGTVLVDDIGEGLDFDRSTSLIELLERKAQNSKIQLIMSTNNRFVMNSVSLDYWQVINRKGSIVSLSNKENSKEIFEEFEYTGLSNFDFFKSGFYKTGFEKENLN